MKRTSTSTKLSPLKKVCVEEKPTTPTDTEKCLTCEDPHNNATKCADCGANVCWKCTWTRPEAKYCMDCSSDHPSHSPSSSSEEPEESNENERAYLSTLRPKEGREVNSMDEMECSHCQEPVECGRVLICEYCGEATCKECNYQKCPLYSNSDFKESSEGEGTCVGCHSTLHFECYYECDVCNEEVCPLCVDETDEDGARLCPKCVVEDKHRKQKKEAKKTEREQKEKTKKKHCWIKQNVLKSL